MKIVKSNAGIKKICDTDTLSVEYYNGNTINLKPLHHTAKLTDYEFLKQYFPEDHYIFIDFGNSYFYVLSEIETTDKEELTLEEAFKKLLTIRAWYKDTTISPGMYKKDKYNFQHGNSIPESRIRMYLNAFGAKQTQIEKWEI